MIVQAAEEAAVSMSFGKKMVYALGQFALVLCAYASGKLFLSYYISGSSPVFTAHIHREALFGLFTIAGLAIALSRLVDAGASLLSGWLSDRSRSRHGRRTVFMLGSAVPVAFASFLVFTPPSGNLNVNSVYVLLMLLVFYMLLSLYATPFLAMLPEMGKTRRERLFLSILLGIATATATLLGNRTFTLAGLLTDLSGIPLPDSFRIVIAGYALVSALFLLLPAFLLRESNPANGPIREPFSRALVTVLGDAHFRSYLLADIMFRIASALVIAGFSWFVTVLLELDQRTANVLLLMVFFSNLALFFPVYLLVNRWGKRRILFASYLLFMAALVASVFAGMYPVDSLTQGIILAFMLSVPYAVFTVLPNALVSDLVVAAERKTGEQRGGMYFAVHALIVKIGAITAGLLFPLFTIFVHGAIHREPETAGLRLVLVLSALCSLIGFFALFGYHEKEVSAVLGDKN